MDLFTSDDLMTRLRAFETYSMVDVVHLLGLLTILLMGERSNLGFETAVVGLEATFLDALAGVVVLLSLSDFLMILGGTTIDAFMLLWFGCFFFEF